jgi:translation initiation factor IF-2
MIAKNPEIDPTIKKVELKLGDKTYFLAFTYGSLVKAEAELRKLGVQVNMLEALDVYNLDATKLSAVLYAAIISFDPSFTPESVTKLIKVRNIPDIRIALLNTLEASFAEPEEESTEAPLDPAIA